MVSALALSLMLASWVQVSSNTFVVKSSAGEEKAIKVLKELEAFRQLVGNFVFRTVELPELPIEVLLIGDDAQLKELAPEYNGRKLGVAGYYQRGQDRDFIVLSGRVFPQTLTSIVYHELTHYFVSRALVDRPTWLNEGLAEYFAMADIGDEETYLGALSPERLQLLKTNRMLPLGKFFAVDTNSSYYNEVLKANAFYAQAWAFVHFLMHGEHAEGFTRYIDALAKKEVNLMDYLKVNERDLEVDFSNYVNLFIRRVPRQRMKAPGEEWKMKVESIPEPEAQMSISEIFLANGKIVEARRHLEMVAAADQEFPRASYYRGVLARITGEGDARDLFVDALTDPHLGPRAAFHLVQMRELNIPAVRTALEQAAAAGTRVSNVYWALSEIYLDDIRRIQETVRLTQQESLPSLPSYPTTQPPAAEAVHSRYAEGVEHNIRYRLLSESASGPQVQVFVPPYYPAELIGQKLAGEVVVDIQLTEEGDVAGLWLVSATPDIFGGLATAAVRQWKFEAVPAKIRVVLEFTP